MPVSTDYDIGSDPALWPPQGPMQGMAGGSGAPYPMNPGTPYNQGSLDVGGYPGNQPQRTPMSMRMYRNFCIHSNSVLMSVCLYVCPSGLSFTGKSASISNTLRTYLLSLSSCVNHF